MRKLKTACMVLVWLWAVSFSGTAFATDKVALVIGNQAYSEAGVLQRPVADAKLMATALKSQQVVLFEGKAHYDLNGAQMESLLQRFSTWAKQQSAQAAVVYYAGHGVQYGGKNYLIPVDVGLADRVKMKHKAVNLSMVLDYLHDAQTPVNLVFLDACRNNPFRGSRGLTRIAPPADSETLISYSTAANDVAADASPYTPALARLIREQPNLTIERLLKKVKSAVSTATNGKQNPDYNSSFGDRDFCFGQCFGQRVYSGGAVTVPAPAQNGATAITPPVQPPVRPPVRQDFEPGMVFIKGGTFTMGSPANEKGRFSNERQHQVTVGDFYMGKYEVTFAEWDRCVAEKGCKHRPKDEGWGRGTRPVINVSWHDAQEYVRWLNRKTGKQYRLPTEAEWEYAARAGSKTAYPWGNNISCPQADYWQDDGSCHGRGTSAVGRFAANRWGLHDTVGNVEEWTCSAYDKNYGGAEQRCASGSAGDKRSLRGGSWNNLPRDVRSANRDWYIPTYRLNLVGFRLSRTP